MVTLFGSPMLAAPAFAQPVGASGAAPRLRTVATFEHPVTGVTAAKDGRLFVNFPRWGEDAPVSVAEVQRDGTIDITTSNIPEMSWFKPNNSPTLKTALFRIDE